MKLIICYQSGRTEMTTTADVAWITFCQDYLVIKSVISGEEERSIKYTSIRSIIIA